jgi:anaerobic magnesium-protoporphyrin IX monomethyl ester cyclase
MNVLLIGPYEGKNVEKLRFIAPPLGIHRIASYLRRNDIPATVFDPYIENVDDLEKLLTEITYEIIGFSMTYMTLENDMSLVYLCKKISPGSILVGGGIEATFNHLQILRSCPVDILVLGEGEKPLLNICKVYKKGLNLIECFKQIGGLLIKDNSNLVFTGYNKALSASEFEDMTVNMDFNGIPYQKYWALLEKLYAKPNMQEIRSIRLFTANYCPYKCTFCSSTNFLDEASGTRGKKRTKIVELTAERIIILIKKALISYPLAETFILQDDNFMLKKQRIVKLCELIRTEKENKGLPKSLSFICQSRVDDVDPYLLKDMSTAGFRLIGYGVESFSEKILNDLNKKTTIQTIWNAINWTLDVGIKSFLNIILFPPSCTKEDLLITIDGCIKSVEMGCEVAIEPYIMPLSGSDIAKEKDLIRDEKNVIIPGTDKSIVKSDRLLPNDEFVREIASKFDKYLPDFLRYFSEKYGLMHLSTRVRSLISFYVVCNILEDEDRKKRIEKLISQWGQ